MLDLIRSPFKLAFDEFANSITSDCLICSPYITFGPMKMLVRAIAEKKSPQNVQINILTDISLRTLVQGATDLSALQYLFENHQNVFVTYLPRIHAKVYVSDKSCAIVASANFTDGGATRNLEYGVRIEDTTVVQKIRDDINQYKNLGANVTPDQLKEIQAQVENIRKTIRVEQETITQKIRLESRKLERTTEDNLIRVRVNQKSINSIFSGTILYLLSQKSMPTEELHLLVKDIHPDLCDDTLDRIIDGRHFGKLWKHQVRNAQSYLKSAGAIIYDKETDLWRKTAH
ncbi:MAG: phospholipase D family protein [Chloroflexi bacterium]|nr:phospholipase D family protein [Chloroflexota bacterium]